MSTHFVRILDRNAVNDIIGQLSAVAERKFPKVRSKDQDFKIEAPDGDEVFTGIRHPSGRFICRLHREVFSDA